MKKCGRTTKNGFNSSKTAQTPVIQDPFKNTVKRTQLIVKNHMDRHSQAINPRRSSFIEIKKNAHFIPLGRPSIGWEDGLDDLIIGNYTQNPSLEGLLYLPNVEDKDYEFQPTISGEASLGVVF
jgi:hypothetical protein